MVVAVVAELDATAVPSISGITQPVGVPAAVPLEAKTVGPKGVSAVTPRPVVVVVLPVYVFSARAPASATTNNLKVVAAKAELFFTVASCPVALTPTPELALTKKPHERVDVVPEAAPTPSMTVPTRVKEDADDI
jgi:hypothetical protein